MNDESSIPVTVHIWEVSVQFITVVNDVQTKKSSAWSVQWNSEIYTNG